jgi:hypothetical protein
VAGVPVRFVVLAYESAAPSDVPLSTPETGTLVIDGVVHPFGYDGFAAALSGISVVDAGSLDDVLDTLPPVGTFEVRPAEVR